MSFKINDARDFMFKSDKYIWCEENLGTEATSMRRLSKNRRWHVLTNEDSDLDPIFVYHFLDENDATQFKLAWI
jgi:hypothetical protein